MSDDNIRVQLEVSTEEANASIAAVKEKADAATADWKIKRRVMLTEINQAISAIGQVYSSFTSMLRLMGAQIDPFFSSLIGMAMSSVSMMLSIASLSVSTGVGAGWGAVLMALTLSVQGVMIADLIKNKAEVMGLFDSMKAGSAASAIGKGMLGGGF